MGGFKKRNDIGKGVGYGLVAGITAGVMFTFALAAAVATLQSGEVLGIKATAWAANGIRAMSAFVAGLIAGRKSRGVVPVFAVGSIYWLLLAIFNVACFGGEFESLLSGAVSVLMGICVSAIAGLKSQTRRNAAKRRWTSC